MNDTIEQFSEPMIFVTGASRSGTTMLSRILGQHSDVSGLKELHCFGDLCDPEKLYTLLSRDDAISLATELVARSKRDVWTNSIEEDWVDAEKILSSLQDQDLVTAKVISVTMNAFAVSADKKIPCEQTPRNIFYTKRLLETYPNLKIVHIVRDPRDVLASQKNRWQRKRLGGHNVPYSEIIRVWFNYHPFTIGKLWVKANQLALQCEEHDRFFMLRFEDLIENPEAQVKRICKFLNLSYEEIMLDIPQVGSSHSANAAQTSGVNKSALNRWESVLSAGELIVCEAVTKTVMEKFSYTRKSNRGIFSSATIMQILKYPLHAAGVMLSNPRRAWIQFQAVICKAK